MREFLNLGGRRFPSKEYIKAFIRAMVKWYKDGQSLNSEDFGVVRDLLNWHPDREEKVGCGVASIEVQTNCAGRGRAESRGFWLTRTDGSREIFSWHACLSPSSHRGDVLKAMRTALVGQRNDFRNLFLDENPGATCPVSGELLTSVNCHAHHVEPNTFDVLAQRFLEERAIDVETVEVAGRFDEGGMYLVDAVLRSDWAEFHHKHARFRLLSKKGHVAVHR